MIAAEPARPPHGGHPVLAAGAGRGRRDPVELLALLGLDAGAARDRRQSPRALRAAAAASRCACPPASWRGCAAATRTTRCCARCCRSREELLPAAGLRRRSAARRRAARRAPGLLQKYAGPGAAGHHRRLRRALPLLLPPALRLRAPTRRTTGQALGRGPARRSRPTSGIEEVILSGGDPLSLGNARLAQLLERAAGACRRCAASASTRARRSCCPRASMPDCCAALHGLRVRLVIVVHANHPAETRCRRRRARCGAAAATACPALLNQSVLLAGVNDDAGRAGGPVATPVRVRRAALLPAPARPGGRHGAFRGAATSGRWTLHRGAHRHACPATSCRGWCARLPGASGKTPLVNAPSGVL